MDLTDDQLERYARHIVLKEIGGGGQKQLLAAKVLIIGAGGLGAPCLQYLAAAGVGTIGVVDDDQVDLSNLQRQVLYGTADIARLKVESAADAVARLNPDVTIIPYAVRIAAHNAADIVAAYDVVADGSDNFETRFAVADACLALKKPLVSAAVGSFEGQISVFKGYDEALPCYRCFVPASPGANQRTCADVGILGALTGVIGSLQALEVIREIIGFGQSLAGRLLIYDGLLSRMRTLSLPKDPGCPVCRGKTEA